MQKVFVNSLPKSGTNLVAKCLELMGYRQSGHIDASLVTSRKISSFLRRIYFHPFSSSGYLVGIDMPLELSRRAINRIITRTKPQEFVAGHVGYNAELLDVIKENGYAPILILRDPRAVLNSFVHYVSTNKKHALYEYFKSKTKDEKYNLTLHGVKTNKVQLQSLLNRCKAMDPWLSDPAVLKLKFEDLIGSSGGGSDETQKQILTEISSFIGCENIDISEISEKVFGAGRHTFRKGVINSWAEEMPVNIQSDVNKVMHDILISWGYEADN